MTLRKPKLLAVIFAAASIAVLSNAKPVLAQYGYGYSPYYGGSSWLYLARSLVNPGNMLYRGGYGYNAGGYLANSLLWNAAYAAGQGINNVQRRNQINNYYSQQAVDQVSPAKWAYPQLYTNQQNAPVIPGASQGTQEPDPLFTPIPTSLNNNPYQPTNAMPGGYPQNPLANPYLNPAQYPNVGAPTDMQANQANPVGAGKPSKKKKYKSQKRMPDPAPGFQPPTGQTNPPNGTASGTITPFTGPAPFMGSGQSTGPAPITGTGSLGAGFAQTKASPFSQAFVDHINNNFNGDLGKALSDKETRGYAKAVGLIDQENSGALALPQDRIDMIHQIMSDPAEDATTKINTVRLLLRHGK